MRRTLACAALGLVAGAAYVQWLAPRNVADWLLAGMALCG
jgi:hypothetical protein